MKRIKFFCTILICLVLLLACTSNKSYRTEETPMDHKPFIYIYPESELDVTIKVSDPEKFSVTYPLYNNGWNVKALQDGTLIADNKQYYGLYWEGRGHPKISHNYGFVVRKDEITNFLEEKLTILGLDWKERNEFIIYWLPQLISNKYTFITFAKQKDIEEYMGLEINPQPETLIRIFMFAKKVDKDYVFEKQVLTPVERTGYTVVEWGGSIEK